MGGALQTNPDFLWRWSHLQALSGSPIRNKGRPSREGPDPGLHNAAGVRWPRRARHLWETRLVSEVRSFMGRSECSAADNVLHNRVGEVPSVDQQHARNDWHYWKAMIHNASPGPFWPKGYSMASTRVPRRRAQGTGRTAAGQPGSQGNFHQYASAELVDSRSGYPPAKWAWRWGGLLIPTNWHWGKAIESVLGF